MAKFEGKSKLKVGTGKNAETYELVFDATTYWEIEEDENLGYAMEDLLDKFTQKMSLGLYIRVLYHALRGSVDSPSQAAKIITEAGLEPVVKALQSAMEGSVAGAKKPATQEEAKESE